MYLALALQKSFAEHECTLRIDVVMNVEQAPAQNNRVTDISAFLQCDYY